jgi:hypothetical protein
MTQAPSNLIKETKVNAVWKPETKVTVIRVLTDETSAKGEL